MPVAQRIQSIERGMRILTLVSRSAEGLTLSALAAATGLQPTTTHNLARTLVELGFLRKAPRPTRYLLGPAVFSLVRSEQGHILRRRAGEVLADLARRFPYATASFAEPIGEDAIMRLRASPQMPGVVEQPQSSYLGPYSSATGLLFQAFWTDDQRRACRRRYPFDEHGFGAWGTVDRLDAYLREVRKLGYAAPASEQNIRVAAPVFSAGHELVGAVGLSTPADQAGPGTCAQLIDAARAAAANISRSLEADTTTAKGADEP